MENREERENQLKTLSEIYGELQKYITNAPKNANGNVELSSCHKLTKDLMWWGGYVLNNGLKWAELDKKLTEDTKREAFGYSPAVINKKSPEALWNFIKNEFEKDPLVQFLTKEESFSTMQPSLRISTYIFFHIREKRFAPLFRNIKRSALIKFYEPNAFIRDETKFFELLDQAEEIDKLSFVIESPTYNHYIEWRQAHLVSLKPILANGSTFGATGVPDPYKNISQDSGIVQFQNYLKKKKTFEASNLGNGSLEKNKQQKLVNGGESSDSLIDPLSSGYIVEDPRLKASMRKEKENYEEISLGPKLKTSEENYWEKESQPTHLQQISSRSQPMLTKKRQRNESPMIPPSNTHSNLVSFANNHAEPQNNTLVQPKGKPRSIMSRSEYADGNLQLISSDLMRDSRLSQNGEQKWKPSHILWQKSFLNYENKYKYSGTSSNSYAKIVDQANKCFSCNAPISSHFFGLFGNAEFCNFTQKWFCTSCIHPSPFPIPGKVCESFDLGSYKVSKSAFNELNKLYDIPNIVIEYSDKIVHENVKLFEFLIVRRQIHLVYDTICNPYIMHDITKNMHLLLQKNLFSLHNLIDIARGTLKKNLEHTYSLALTHITRCDVYPLISSHCPLHLPLFIANFEWIHSSIFESRNARLE